MRKGRDKSIPIIAGKIKKRNEIRAKGKGIKNFPAHGLPSYLPSSSVAEDEESILKHQHLMKIEIVKRNPDALKINSSMIATFNKRRAQTVQDCATLKMILETYPALKDCQQVRLE